MVTLTTCKLCKMTKQVFPYQWGQQVCDETFPSGLLALLFGEGQAPKSQTVLTCCYDCLEDLLTVSGLHPLCDLHHLNRSYEARMKKCNHYWLSKFSRGKITVKFPGMSK